MIMQSIISRHPGKRIEDYRNSTPRIVKLMAVGRDAEQIIADVNKQERNNVLMSGKLDPQGLLPIDAPVDGLKPHAVVVIHQQGEKDMFPFLIERTASPLSFIVLETHGMHNETTDSRKVRDIRAIADLFVTTSDSGFVQELIDNLAS